MSVLRELKLDQDKCIGCQACSHVCPAGLIRFSDNQTERTIQFAQTCAEDCHRCAEVCSEEAISLPTVSKAVEGFFTAGFPLMLCAGCGSAFATQKMVKKLHASIPDLLVPQNRDWISICLSCRQKIEAQNISEQGRPHQSLP
jgi:ferredoxin